MLSWLGYECEKPEPAKITMTFDIDFVFKWKSFKNLGGAFLRNGLNFDQSIKDLISFVNSRKDNFSDPYFSFDFILAALSHRQQKAVFYFKSELEKHIFDNADYDLKADKIQAMINKILDGGHDIGLHPSYLSFKNPSLLALEKTNMKDALQGRPLLKVRQHYLRIQYPDTYHQLQKEGFEEDSSSMYTHYSGFRNGIATRFHPFDFLSHKELQISIIPLVSMMSVSRSIPLEAIVAEMIDLSKLVIKYHGEAMLLWHNSDLDTPEKKKALETVLDVI